MSARALRSAAALAVGALLLSASGPFDRATRGVEPDTIVPPPASIPYVRYLQTFPDRPHSSKSTIVAVIGDFPFPCGEVFLANARDSAHIVVSIRPRASCPDTTTTIWYEALILGQLPPGRHRLELLLNVEQDPAAPGGTSEYRGDIEFDVLDTSTPARRATWAEVKRRYR